MSARDKLTISPRVTAWPRHYRGTNSQQHAVAQTMTSAHCGPQLQSVYPRHYNPQVQPYKRSDRYTTIGVIIHQCDMAPYGEDPDKQWEVCAEVLKKAKEAHIPSRDIGQGRRHRRGPPIDKATYEVMKKKHRAWRRYIEMRDDNKYN